MDFIIETTIEYDWLPTCSLLALSINFQVTIDLPAF